MRLKEKNLRVIDLQFGSVDAEADRRLAEYFVNTPQAISALHNTRSHYIGRKGSGKSALFSQLPRLMQEKYGREVKVISITPDQYAWGALRQYSEQGLLPEQAHTNAWKFTIAVEASSSLLEYSEENLSDIAIEALKKIRKFVVSNFGQEIPNITSTALRLLQGLESFNLEAFGFGIGFSNGQNSMPLTPQIIDLLLESVDQVCQDIGILITIDRLDDSWDGSSEAQTLLIGLLKAAKEINDKYSRTVKSGIHVTTFLRSDIYEGLYFDDKDKHRSIEEEILWNPELLREMITQRLPQDISIDEVFEDSDMRGSIPPFNYIVKRTFLRPREVIQFLQECQNRSGPSDEEISKQAIRDAEERYSLWKVEDLKQENRRVFSEFDTALESLRQGFHRFDSIEEFSGYLEDKIPNITGKYGSRRIMERLFDASVIGIRLGNSGTARFKCEESNLLLPASGAVYVHQSLHKGLNIRERRNS